MISGFGLIGLATYDQNKGIEPLFCRYALIIGLPEVLVLWSYTIC